MPLSTILGLLLPQLVTSGAVTRNDIIVPRFSPQCISQNVDPSCVPLVGSCMDKIASANIDNFGSIRSCVAAATCYGVGNLLGAICCQTGLCSHFTDEASLDYVNVYAPMVGSCAFATGGCPITQQNYVDFYYRTISAINSTVFPTSSSIVITAWSSIVSWTGFCGSDCSTGSVPYLNFNDWLHFSSSFTPPGNGVIPSQTPATGTNSQPITFVPFNSNPVPPSNATRETFVAPRTTVAFSLPTALTTVALGAPTVVITTITTTVIQTVSGVPTTLTSTTTSTATAALAVTVQPGGQVDESEPTQVSQPGAITPPFNSKPFPPPVPIPSLDGGGRTPTSSPDTSSYSFASSSAACKPITVYCDTECYDDFGLTDALISDMDLNSDDKLALSALRRRAPNARFIGGCQRVASTNNGASKYTARSVTHTMFDFTAPNGNSFSLSRSTPVSKPAGAITEHIFEFQVFTQFIEAFSGDSRNSALGGCMWLIGTFYAGGATSLAQAVVNRIDSINNLVYASNYINSAKLAVIGRHSNVGTTGLRDGFPPKNSQAARKKLEMLIRAFGAFPHYMNANAGKYESTAQDIIVILQMLDRATSSVANPPVAIQFYEFLVNHVSRYSNNAQLFGTSLAAKYDAKVIANNQNCITISATQMIVDLQMSFPFLNTANLLPSRPLCFPNTSPGKVGYVQNLTPHNLDSTITDGVLNGVDMKMNLLTLPGQYYVISPLSSGGPPSPACALIRELVLGTPAPAPPLFQLSCNTRRLTIVSNGTTLSSCGLITYANNTQNLFCGPSSTALQQCVAAVSTAGATFVQVDFKWVPV